MKEHKDQAKPTTARASQLGSNCWKPARFSGGECKKVKTCAYPEKKTCEAHYDTVRVTRTPVRIFAKEVLSNLDSTLAIIAMKGPDMLKNFNSFR